MDALLIAPALALSFGVSLFTGKALLNLFMASMENSRRQRKPQVSQVTDSRQSEEIAAA